MLKGRSVLAVADNRPLCLSPVVMVSAADLDLIIVSCTSPESR